MATLTETFGWFEDIAREEEDIVRTLEVGGLGGIRNTSISQILEARSQSVAVGDAHGKMVEFYE